MADDAVVPVRRVLIDRAFVADTYTELGAEGAVPAGDVIVPLVRFLADVSLSSGAGDRRVGVLVQPGEDVRALRGQLARVSLVVLRFPKAAEGRPYSQARILRGELAWTGPIRATGAVLRDWAVFMTRCGIDQLVMRDAHDTILDDVDGSVLDSLDSFSARYQPSAIDDASSREALPRTYPLFLKIEGRDALVVGAGTMAEKKAEDLRAAGARVRVQSVYRDGDAKGARIVIAATGVRATDRAIAEDARKHGALVNAVDDVEACDFYAGGVVRRGPVIVAVGTSGASPSLARAVRILVDAALPAAIGPLAEALGHARPALLARYPQFADRASRLEQFVDGALARVVAKASTTRADAAKWIHEELLSDGGRQLAGAARADHE